MSKAIKTFIPLPFPTDNFKTIWDIWKDYRYNELKKPAYKNAGLKRIFNQLVRLSNNDETIAIKLLEHAMDRNWESIHPIQEELTLGVRKKLFFEKLTAFKEKNAGTYPAKMYKEFFDYWTKEDSLTDKMAFEKLLVFNFEEKLTNWHKNMDKEKLSQMWKEMPVSKQLNLEIFKSNV